MTDEKGTYETFGCLLFMVNLLGVIGALWCISWLFHHWPHG